jgi:2-amino-4-hydroxy-6-hydroxymethyldihydropteridine diphosphokinase
MAIAYLGLGSNIGDRLQHLQAAVDWLSHTGTSVVLRVSSVYETEPVGPRNQPWFLNAVAEVCTELPPDELRGAVKLAEAQIGRTSGVRWGPRVIDIDILLYDSVRIQSDQLTIPHAEMWKRLFVLEPLRELRPDLHSPDGVTIGAWIDRMPRSHSVHLSALAINLSSERKKAVPQSAAPGAGRRLHAH